MKNMILIPALFILFNASAQDAKYNGAMEKNVAILDTAKETSTFTGLANTFERIANANQDLWLPYYYQSFCTVMTALGQTDNNRKDEFLDHAEQLAGHADSLSPDNSEIYVLKSFVNSMKISVDPMTRGQKLGMQSQMLTAKALKLNPDNPRALFLKGSGLMYTPAQYGGGKDKAIPVLEEAVEKYKTDKPDSPIAPHWGAERAKATLENAKKQ